MNKSTIAAIAAASLIGFGAAGTAMAETEISGYTDIRYNITEDQDSLNSTAMPGSESGNFGASGEIDVVSSGNGATVRMDLDILDILDPNPQTDTNLNAILGFPDNIVTVEQMNISFGVPGVEDMVSLTAGIENSPFGYEGQDSPDIPFANNGLLWRQVPSNIVGALATIAPSEQLSVNVGYVNSRADATGVVSDRANEYVVTANMDVAEGIGVGVGYFSEEDKAAGTAGGALIDLYVSADLGMATVAAEYLMADPDNGSTNFDSGYGVHAGTDLGMATVNARYEFSENESTGTDETTAVSVVAGYKLADNTELRLDYTNTVFDTGVTTSADDIVVQFVTTF